MANSPDCDRSVQWQSVRNRPWAILCAFAALSASAQNLPTLPQSSLDTSYPLMTGNTISVPAGGDLQNALNNAQPGDTIQLEAGATFAGQFTLPVKSGNGWIVVRTSAADSSLPPQGSRITPSYASVLPKIVSPNDGPALQTAAGAHHYRIVGVEITAAASVALNYNLVALGDDSNSNPSVVASNLILDRVYIHGQPNNDQRRGVALNSATSAVVDSYIADIHELGADSQAIAGWNGAGPFKISDNYLEAAGENVLFGGADPAIANLVPSDIEIRGNHLVKQTSWNTTPAKWTVKNLLELKNAQRVFIDGNIFENNWPGAQNGYSILFTVRNQGGTAPWSVVQDVTFTHNIVRHVASGVNILGTDNLNPSQQTKRLLIANNLFDDVSQTNWGGDGRLFQLIDGALDVTIDHNTGFQTGEIIVASGAPNLHFVYRNNLTPHNQYGVAGDNYFGDPMGALNTYFPGYVFRRNVLQGGNPSQYPPDNFFPATMAEVQFVDQASGNYRLKDTSPYKNAGTDGRDVGVDMDALDAATKASIDMPSMFSATATSLSQVSLTWLPVGGASSYEVYRTSTVNGLYTLAVATSSTSATDSLLLPNTTYLYKVRALGNGGTSAFSPIDAATTIIFTDPSLTGLPVKAVHLNEIRTAVNAMRTAAVLLPATFTDLAVPGTVIKSVHVTELRTSLDEARSTLGLSAIAYTDSTITPRVTLVKAAHFQEIRRGTQ